MRWARGYSGPIGLDKLVFSTESIDEYELIRAYNRQDGKLVWQTKWEGKMKVPFFAAKNGRIRSTPVYDGENIYVCGMRDVLLA